uniref:Vasohibin-2-like isoform x5 n=1 Tax=Tetraselmis sp. GSL018 TaxID=582737 RepID=A0A061SBR0_9CHLO|eukprot:CAMPEP_0177595110 /NCGR_PEP_ID=MMETSP0419_2-20121207/10166_1 /TAXON_ID=582737 /ORGANISM="Tetraselmis sp., Strain GSL018" /LENGTH=427 /DNA_ID=CAMNT_0019086517 /DNA_START=79 /DNA_END=1362 /DNA_ORIENTATION=-
MPRSSLEEVHSLGTDLLAKLDAFLNKPEFKFVGKHTKDESPSSSRKLPPTQELGELTSSYPLDSAKWEKVVEVVGACTADELLELGFTAPCSPIPPKTLHKMPPAQRLRVIQDMISSFQYNHTGTNYFNVNKDRPFNQIMATAREIVREPLPIKCIEAAMLGLYFTCGMEDLDRLPLRFKSAAGGFVYRHIVLAVHERRTGAWGALGISRRPDLMFKELSHETLSALITDYKDAYEKWGHKLLRVRVGLPAEHSVYFTGRINWCYTSATPRTRPWAKCCAAFEAHAAKMRRDLEKWRALGSFAGKQGREGATWAAYRRASLTEGSHGLRRKAKRHGLGGHAGGPKASETGAGAVGPRCRSSSSGYETSDQASEDPRLTEPSEAGDWGDEATGPQLRADDGSGDNGSSGGESEAEEDGEGKATAAASP